MDQTTRDIGGDVNHLVKSERSEAIRTIWVRNSCTLPSKMTLDA